MKLRKALRWVGTRLIEVSQTPPPPPNPLMPPMLQMHLKQYTFGVPQCEYCRGTGWNLGGHLYAQVEVGSVIPISDPDNTMLTMLFVEEGKGAIRLISACLSCRRLLKLATEHRKLIERDESYKSRGT